MTSSLLDPEYFGMILLEHTPLRRFGRPPEVVGAAVFLALDAAEYMTGSVVHVEGGLLAH